MRDMNDKLTKFEINSAYILFQVRAGIEDVALSLKQARTARQMSMQMVADKLEISVSAYSQIEKNASRGRVSLRQLQRVAGILDCEIQWQLRSKSKKPLARDVWDQLLPYALKHPAFKNCRRRLGWARKSKGHWPRYLCWNQKRWPFI
jgi:transcriptional regulator with XRE-family HTH domain